MLIRIAACIFFLLFSFTKLKAQHLEGYVFDMDTAVKKTPLEGATLKWKGFIKGAIADDQGYFHLDFPDSAKEHFLVVSYIGYGADTILITTQKFIAIYLSEEIQTHAVVIEVEKKGSYMSRFTMGNTEMIGSKELLRAACCNLSESFETNPSVDINYADAISGAKQIRMLGLDGVYTQMMKENMPAFRGLANTYGLSYLPGSWIESIQLTKGAGSVINGYESMAGQINVELKKPLNSEPLLVNIYTDNMLREELNINTTKKFSDNFGTTLLLHGDQNFLKMDRNNDGFLDVPLSKQFDFMNKWEYFDNKKIESQFGISGIFQNRVGGQMNFNPESDKLSNSIYGIGINTNRWEAYGKLGLVFPDKPYKSIGLMLNFTDHNQDNYFGTHTYSGKEQSFYSNLIYQSIIGNTDHKFKAGASFEAVQLNENIKLSGLDTNPSRKELVPGVFTEYNYSHGEKFSATVGMRADYHNLYGAMYTPRIHTKYSPWENATIRLSAGKGYRTPYIFTENMGIWASSRKLIIEDKTEQEISWNYGGSIQQAFKIAGKNASLNLDFYRTDFQKQMVVDLDMNPQEIHIYQLKEPSFANSFQADLTYDPFKNLSIRTAWKDYDVRVDYKGEVLQKPFVPRQRFLTTASYYTKYKKYVFDATALWFGTSRIPSTLSNPVEYQLPANSPTYWVFNFQVTRNFKRWSVYAGSENLLDYRQKNPIIASEAPFGSYFDASMIWGPVEGRRIYAGLRFKISE